MSIERTLPPSPLTGVSSLQEKLTYSTTRPLQTTPREGRQPETVQVTLSHMARQLDTDSSRDINRPRLEHIRAAMESGEWLIDSDKIASALVDDIFQLI